MARILVIEDNADNRELMSYLLRAHGHAIETAADGELALEALAGNRFDLIICDVHLPKVDGLQIVATVKSTHALRSVPIVAVTALAMVGDRERLLAAGFDAYVPKPIEPESFVGQVEECLSQGARGAKSADVPREPA
jgi:two-component system cell cycle response regulator